jgi:hypothetical protein
MLRISKLIPSILTQPKPDPATTPTPKPRRLARLRLLPLLLLGVLLAVDADAARPRRRTARSRPAPRSRAPAVRPPPRPAPAKPKEVLRPFRELAVGAEFYYPTDRDRRLFPLKKISATHARPLGTAGTDPSVPVAIPGELNVILKKTESRATVTR